VTSTKFFDVNNELQLIMALSEAILRQRRQVNNIKHASAFFK